MQIKYIPLGKLKPPEFDAHQTPNDEADNDLAESIRTHGILEPLEVRPVSDGMEIIFGARRFRAAMKVGLPAAPCIITKATDAEAETRKYHENIKRLPLSHVDQALTFQHMRTKFKMTETQIAKVCKVSIAYVSQHLSLLQSDPVLVDSVKFGRLNFSVAREFMQIDDQDERRRLMSYAENDGMTAESAHLCVQQYKHDKKIMDNVKIDETVVPEPSEPREWLYICQACDGKTRGCDLKIVRICKYCHKIIFDALDKEKIKNITGPESDASKDQS